MRARPTVKWQLFWASEKFDGSCSMNVKFTVNRAGLRQLERDVAKNLRKAIRKKLPAGVDVADGDAEGIAKQVGKEIETAFKEVNR